LSGVNQVIGLRSLRVRCHASNGTEGGLQTSDCEPASSPGRKLLSVMDPTSA
jgi:hypothetical protein